MSRFDLFTRPAALVPLFAALLAVAGCNGDDDAPPPECMANADCAEGQVCTEMQTCVAGECTLDEDCKRDDDPTQVDGRKQCNVETFMCDFREGFADDCDNLRPCPFGEFCSPLVGRCLNTSAARDCTRRSQCPAGQICDRSANKCIEDPGCFNDDFCDDGEICDTVNRICRALAVECTPCQGADMTCGDGQTCASATSECLAAGAEPACTGSEFCDLLGRCVQCTNNSQCGPGLFCNTALGRCDSNTQCAPDPSECPESQNVMCILCPPPQVCNLRTRRCEAPARECESDVECEPSEFCDLTLDIPICVDRLPACINDLLEGDTDNNSIGRAALLERVAGPLFDELVLCPGEADWYRIEVPAGTYLTVDARFDHDAGDIDMQLFLEDGTTLLDESRSTTDNERVELEVGTDRALLVRVFFQVPVVQPVPYKIVAALDDGAICPDDGNEPDDSIGDAKDLVTDAPYEGRLCTADPDWFVLRNVPSGQRITVNLTFTDSLGDLDMQLFRNGSPTPLLEALSLDDNETLTYDASFGGDYFIRVFAKGGDTNVYTLRADLRDNPAAVCMDDQFEPNNAPAQPTLTPDQTGDVASDLSICSGDEDWYQVNLGPDELLKAEIGFEASADLELKLYAPGADSSTTAPIRASTGLSTREYVAFRAQTPGDYLIRVHGLSERDITPYELRVSREPPFICDMDRFDMMMQGNTADDPIPLPRPGFIIPSPGEAARIDDVTLCNGDEDFYDLLLLAGFRHTMRIQYLDEDATLDFALQDPTGATLFTSTGFGVDFKEVGINVPGAGAARLILRVFRTAGAEAAYSVVVDSVPLTNCFPDMNEPNDTNMFATTITASTATVATTIDVNNQMLCTQTVSAMTGVGDQDIFVFTPLPDMLMQARLTHATGDVDMELFSPGGEVRACPNFGPNRCLSARPGPMDEEITFTATTAAPYFLRVYSVFGDPAVLIRPPGADTTYDLQFTFTPASP